MPENRRATLQTLPGKGVWKRTSFTASRWITPATILATKEEKEKTMDSTWFGAGIGVGFASSMGIWMSVGAGGVRKKLVKQLAAAIEAGDISVVSKIGEPMTAEAILEFLEEKEKWA